AALLPLAVGATRSAEAILTGAPRPAAAWHAAGVVTWVAPRADLEREVDRWFAEWFAPKSAAALRHAVSACRLARLEHVRRAPPRLEQLYLNDLMQTEDAVEGVTAFLQKRLPQWRDQ